MGLNLINQAISIYDANLKLVVSNRRFQEMFSLPDHLVVPGGDFAETIRFLVDNGSYGPIDDTEEFVRARVDQALAFEPHYFERPFADGYLSVEGSPLQMGGWVTVYTDITEIKRQETLLRSRSEKLSDELLTRSEELAKTNRNLAATNDILTETQRSLRDSEQRTRMTAEMTPAHIGHLDLNAVYTYSNHKLATLIPNVPRDIRGMTMAAAIGPETYPKIEPYLHRAFEGEENVFEFTDTPSGHRIRCAFTPDVSTAGDIRGAYVLSMDITEETQARSALAHAHKKELAAQLASGLAHDFSNLLTIVVGLQTKLSRLENMPAEAVDLIATTKSAAMRGGSLLNRLLDLTVQRDLTPEPVEIDDMLTELRNLGRAALRADVALVIDNQTPATPVMLDRGGISDALLNLVINAGDAISGAGTVTVAAHALSDDWLHITVSDTGSGFTDQALERALDPYFTTKPAGAGNGIGLSMVYDIAKLCGGYVRFGNGADGGAYVTLMLPYVAADHDTEPGLVLLVEDNDDIRANVREMLRADGHAVIEANSAEEALSLAKLPGITHVLSDINLAGPKTGLDLGIALDDQNIPVCLMSGLPPNDPIRRAAQARFHVLTKPFRAAQLRHALGDL